jgi:hypothetical protein
VQAPELLEMAQQRPALSAFVLSTILDRLQTAVLEAQQMQGLEAPQIH